MKFDAIETPTIKELFMDKIISLILSGRLSVGERLPTERELAAEMKVSKTIVHLGLTELERMGFVSVVPRKGVFVANYGETGTQETLGALLHYNRGSLDRHTIESMFEFRQALEGASFRRFAAVHTPEDAEAMKELVSQIKSMAADESVPPEVLAERIFDLHHAISVRGQNNVFPLVLNAFRTVSIIFWENGIRMYGRKESAERAELYLTCLLERNPDGADKLLAEDIEAYLGTSF